MGVVGVLSIDRKLLNRASDIVDKLTKPMDNKKRRLLIHEYFHILAKAGIDNVDVIGYRLRIGRPLAIKYIRAQRRLENIESRILFGEV